MGILLRLFAALVVGAYLVLMVAHNVPENPARVALAPVLEAVIGRFFSQNWRLFAPNPPSSNVTVVVSCLDAAGFEEVKTHGEDGVDADWKGRWVDISDPLLKRHQASRLSAYDRLSRAQIGAARNVLTLPIHLVPWVTSCKKGDDKACKLAETEMNRWHKSSSAYLVRVASSYCKSVEPESVAIGLRIRDRKVHPWSERHDTTDPSVADTQVGFFPLSKDVMAAPIYVGAQK